MQNRIFRLYGDLLEKYGDPVKFWPQWCAANKNERLREIIALGAISTQKTSWHNADLALRNLKKERLLSLKRITGLKNLDNLKELIRPAGFYQTKPKRLFGLASFVVRKYGSLEKFKRQDLKIAREELLGLYGIGQETADAILLYVLDQPSFVVDEYTKRLVKKKGLSDKLDYDSLQRLFEENLPRKVKIYQDYHALIIVDQRGQKAAKMEIV